MMSAGMPACGCFGRRPHGCARRFLATLIRARLLVAVAALTCMIASAAAQPPDFEGIRYDEDYAELAKLQRPLSSWERFKFIPLTADGGAWLSLGGEVRQRFEQQRNPDFGETLEASSVWLQRAILAADLHVGPVRFYGQLLHATENGRPGGPSPVDRNDLDVQNAFVELSLPEFGGGSATARIGRQEMKLGSGRLVDPREGPNVRRTFDGGRGIVTHGAWTVSALAVRPRLDRFGAFDDRTNDEQSLFGVYAVGRDAIAPGATLDLYVLGYENEAARFVQGSGAESRTSIGARWSGMRGGLDWNWEVVGQTGQFGDAAIQAWTVATDTGLTFTSLPFSPRLALSANAASGDSDASDDRLETFNPMFPRGNYFSEAAILGPRNFVNLHPFLTLQLTDRISLTTDVNFFWRLEDGDGVYTPSGALLRAPVPDADRYVATAVSANVTWAITPFVDANAIYTRFEPGEFLHDTGPSETVDFVELTVRLRF